MTRAGVILINDQKIALIEREKNTKHYYVFPGGQVEEGESIENAAVREAMEELGLEVQINKLTAVIHYQNELQYYYLVEKISGKFGLGTGPEMIGNYPTENGTYKAVWLPIKDMKKFRILPEPLSTLIIQRKKDLLSGLSFDLNEDPI